MKKVLAEKYGKEYATGIMKKSKKVYRDLVEKADDTAIVISRAIRNDFIRSSVRDKYLSTWRTYESLITEILRIKEKLKRSRLSNRY